MKKCAPMRILLFSMCERKIHLNQKIFRAIGRYLAAINFTILSVLPFLSD